MRVLVAAGLALALSSVVASCTPASRDAATTVSAWVTAINGRQIDQAIAFFDDDATIDDGTLRGGADTVYGWDASLVDRYQLRVLDMQVVSPERAILLFELLPRGRAVSIGTYSFDVWVTDGKIQSLVSRPAPHGLGAPRHHDAVAAVATTSLFPLKPAQAGGVAVVLILVVTCWRRIAPHDVARRQTDGALLRGLRHHVEARRMASSAKGSDGEPQGPDTVRYATEICARRVQRQAKRDKHQANTTT